MRAGGNGKVLVTGGAGFIGSHTCIALIERGIEPVVIDNLSNSRFAVLERIERITGHRIAFYRGDVLDAEALRAILRSHHVAAVMHFAGLKSARESMAQPGLYHRNNVEGTLNLIDAMGAAGIRKLLFSSSAAVYGKPELIPSPESTTLRPETPDGQTKAEIEGVLEQTSRADPSWRIGVLRYFNAVGAHESGLVGEDPAALPANLLPQIARVAAGQCEKLRIFGGDYPTPDGTGIRDYVHVMDLADGHLAALDYLGGAGGLNVLNLGSGKGYSVLEIVEAFAAVSGQPVPYEIVDRQPGDAVISCADAGKAARLLGWHAQRDLRTICADTWRWQRAMR